MRNWLAIAFCVALAGCTSGTKHPYYTPSPAAVIKDLDGAKASVKDVSKYVSSDGKKAVEELQQHIDSAYKSLYTYSVKVADLGNQLQKAQDDANYWRQKHYQDLKIIWFWRLLAFSAVVAVIVYLGLKTSWKFFL